MEIPCYEMNKTVPHFIEIDLEKEGPQNQVVYGQFENLIKEKIRDIGQKGDLVKGGETIPDGMMTIHSANDDKFNYRI